MPSAPSSRRSAGFTLIELLVTLAVLAILVGIGLPAFSELIASQRARAATSALHDSLMLARSEAIKRNISVSLQTTDLATGWTVADSNGKVLRSELGSKGLTFSPAAPAISYNSFGRLPPSTNINITVTAQGSTKSRCIHIDSLGRPQLSDGACT